jgi:hypothetical protein
MMTGSGIFRKNEKRSYRTIIYVDFNLIISRKYRIVPYIQFFILNRLQIYGHKSIGSFSCRGA